jgi:hypothetical protein
MQGTIVSIDVRSGDLVRRGRQVIVMESMKMEHVIAAAESGHSHRHHGDGRRCSVRRRATLAVRAADVEHDDRGHAERRSRSHSAATSPK